MGKFCSSILPLSDIPFMFLSPRPVKEEWLEDELISR
jgi:hypothetical protein